MYDSFHGIPGKIYWENNPFADQVPPPHVKVELDKDYFQSVFTTDQPPYEIIESYNRDPWPFDEDEFPR